MVSGQQFDIFRVVGLRSGSAVDLAMVLQDDALAHLSTRVVAPLILADRERAADRATPSIEIMGVRYIVAVHLMTTVPNRNLGNFVMRIEDRERHIKNAIDLVFFGV